MLQAGETAERLAVQGLVRVPPAAPMTARDLHAVPKRRRANRDGTELSRAQRKENWSLLALFS